MAQIDGPPASTHRDDRPRQIRSRIVRSVNIALWVAQVILAILFLGQGVLKFVQPAGLPDTLAWVYDVTGPIAIVVGVAELAAVAGLILPGLLGIRTWLTPAAAAGLILVMLAAIAFHANRGETQQIVMNVVILAVAAFVAYGRLRVAPLLERGAARV